MSLRNSINGELTTHMFDTSGVWIPRNQFIYYMWRRATGKQCAMCSTAYQLSVLLGLATSMSRLLFVQGEWSSCFTNSVCLTCLSYIEAKAGSRTIKACAKWWGFLHFKFWQQLLSFFSDEAPGQLGTDCLVFYFLCICVCVNHSKGTFGQKDFAWGRRGRCVNTQVFSFSNMITLQWRPLHEHEYTFVSPWFLKVNTFIEKKNSRAFQRYMTLIYWSTQACRIPLECTRTLLFNTHICQNLKFVSPWFLAMGAPALRNP